MIEDINKLKIVEYNDKYADAIAEMWNSSGDCWGGYSLSLSGESVRQEVAQSDHLFVWLAVLNDKVIGYCTLSEYREDEGALYIDVLNVIPEYHGKKIGKKLVLKAVEKTVELGVPRLDLYTWTGNTKAVPLYKKTGFFWVDRDDCTHCMNFIPTVLTSELLNNYISDFDWYKDSARKIAIEPDGMKHDGFEYYQYVWNKGARELEVEFCRYSRGIRRIRTQDFEISAENQRLKQVFGKSYQITYRIRNYTDKPLKISIDGKTNRNIVFDYQAESMVKDEEVLMGTFLVDEPKEKQNKWRTYPAVCADISVNGRSQEFKVGIDPQLPLALSVVGEKQLYSTKHEEILHFNVKNNYDEPATFSWNLNDTDLIQWKQKEFSVKLDAQEQNTIAVPFLLLRAGVLKLKVHILVQLQNGRIVEYSDMINSVFQTTTGMSYGENEKFYALINGKFQVNIDRKDFYNEIRFFDRTSGEYSWHFMFPTKLGKPFTPELHKKRPQKVHFFKADNAVQLDAIYEIEKPTILILTMHLKLYSNGLLYKWFTVKNEAAEDTPEEIFLSTKTYVELHKSVIPYKGKFVFVDRETQNWGELYESSRFDENWIFNYRLAETWGLSWPESFKITFSEEVLFDTCLGRIPAGESMSTEKLTFMLGTFSNWHDFREYVLDTKLEKEQLTDYLEVIVNDGNPFVDKHIPIDVIEYREKSYDIPIDFSARYDSFVTSKAVYTSKQKSEPIQLSVHHPQEYDILIANIKGKTPDKVIKRVIFPICNGEIKTSKSVEEDHKIWSCSNGLITIKAAEEYAPAVYSLMYKGQEWLDSDFPNPGPKSWWSPWIGGINSYPNRMQMRSIIKESYAIEFVSLHDDFNNEWKGVKISVIVNEFEKFKGLSWNQYYLMLPGVPVLCYLPEIIQETGKYLRNLRFISRYFAYADEKIENCFVRSNNSKFEQFDYYSGIEAVDLYPQTVRAVGSTSRYYLMQIWTERAKYNDISLNKDITSFWMYDYANIAHNERRFLAPKFLILTKELLSQDEIRDLRNITFSHKNNQGERL